MITFNSDTRKALLKIYKENGVGLEGNIIKLIDPEDDKEFDKYLKEVSEKDKTSRRKRLEITKQIQTQNKELTTAQEQNTKLMSELKEALDTSTKAKELVEADLDLLQKKTQTELISTIVKVALWIVIGVGIITTLIYTIALLTKSDTTLVGNTWSNMFGILLTNSFSIIGTIMGVKYATEKK